MNKIKIKIKIKMIKQINKMKDASIMRKE